MKMSFSILIDPWNIHMFFFKSLEIPCPQPPLFGLGFFWNSPIHIFLLTHNLQRIIFKIFSQPPKYKIHFKQSNKITKLASMGSYNYPQHLVQIQTGIKAFWRSNPFYLSSQGVFQGPFYINRFRV